MGPTSFIYGLVDPRTHELRYVGQTSIGMQRPLQEHHAHCLRWEKSVTRAGFQKEVAILESCPDDVDCKLWLDENERFYISLFRALGSRLTNIADGGDGGPTRRGRKNSLHHRDALIRSNLGRELSEDHRSKISSAMHGRKLSSEHRSAIGRSLREHKQSEEARKHVQEGLLSYWARESSNQHRSALSERMKRIRNG